MRILLAAIIGAFALVCIAEALDRVNRNRPKSWLGLVVLAVSALAALCGLFAVGCCVLGLGAGE